MAFDYPQRSASFQTTSNLDTATQPKSLQKSALSLVANLLTQTGKSLQRILLPANEPIVSAIKTRSGERVWRVYDPMTGQRTTLSSEVEVRLWLEQLY